MKYLGWLVSWFFYGLGHFTSLIFHHVSFTTNVLYPVYNQLMSWSVRISDRYDLGIWKTRQDRLKIAVDSMLELMEEDDEITVVSIIELLMKDHDPIMVAMIAKEVSQKLFDQVNVGLMIGEEVVNKVVLSEINEAAVGNRTPGVIFMNPRNMIMGSDVVYETPNVLEEAAKKLSLKRDMVRYGEPGIVDKSITPTIENSFVEVPLTDEDYKNDVIFQVGRAYRHTCGDEMMIIGRLKTTLWGECLVAECPEGCLRPVGEDKEAAVNWHMISLDEWNKIFN